MGPVQFSRKPYQVTYYKDGEKHTITRRPPPKVHDMWPKDVVELTTKRNDDWQKGETYTVKGITARQPNTLQIENGDGETTFVSSYDLKLQEARGLSLESETSEAGKARKLPINNRYLTWP